MSAAIFAIPGDKDRKTGGFLYEATVLRVLNDIGCDVRHMVLPDRFPNPTADDMDETLAALRAVAADQPIILDGLVFGAIDPDGLARVGAPVIAMIHHPLGLETGLSAARAAFLLENERRALRFADHVIVPSPHTAKILVDDFGADPGRITVAEPGFTRPNRAPAPCDPPLILSVGLLAARKGHDVLLDALAQITDLAWQAAIVGKAHDPIVADQLRNQCAALGLDDRVHFAGELSDGDLNETFNAASIFALATRYEGYGMVLSEAMLYGLPVVSCSVGAVPDTVGDAGVLVPPDDPAAFADALRLMLEQPETAAQFAQRSEMAAANLASWTDTARIFAATIRKLS